MGGLAQPVEVILPSGPRRGKAERNVACATLMRVIRKDIFAMENTSKSDWVVPALGGMLVAGAILVPVSEGIRDASDVCGVGFTSPVTACQPAILPSPDLPHRDHIPAATRNIAVTVATSTSTAATPTITVAPTSR
jgi:hypothetical protein